ncbi:MAG: DUF2752 domain-containing protein [Planctomycetota bacterium]
MSSSSIDRPRLPAAARLLAALVAVGAAVLLGVSAGLSAADEGHGTHEQLGLPACTWAKQFDAPCMTCGMTTAFTHAADGDLVSSFVTQPMGMLLAVLTAAGFWVALHAAITGSLLAPLLARLLTGRTLIVAGVLAAAAWGYKLLVWNSGAGT